MKLRYLFIMAFLFVLPGKQTFACDTCTVYFGRLSSEIARGFSFGISGQVYTSNSLKLDGEEVPNPFKQSLDSYVTKLYATYTLSDKFTFQMNVPVAYRSFARVPLDGGTVSGVGDISFLVRATLNVSAEKGSSHILRFIAGVKLPTGNSDYLKESLPPPPTLGGGHGHSTTPQVPAEEPSVDIHTLMGVHGHHLALGTGSTDILLGSEFAQYWNNYLVGANLQVVVHGTGAYGYKYAPHWQIEGGPGWDLPLKTSARVTLQANFLYEYKGLDRVQNQDISFTGINMLMIGPLATITFGKSSAYFGVGFPVMVENTGLQVVVNRRIMAGYSVRP